MTYDPAEDGRKSYDAAIEAMRLRLAVALASLASEGIPQDVRAVLMDGDKRLGILPGALHRALVAAGKADRA